MKNPCIATYFMGNVSDKTAELQKKVINKYNKSNVPLYQVEGGIRHGDFIDLFWAMNGLTFESNNKVEQKFDHDVVLFLDIDCIPLNENAIDYYLEQAAAGKLIGNAQRSNHIENNQHVFAAPSALAISRETFLKIGAPLAKETARSDVAEEYTWESEANNVPVELTMPLSFVKAPYKYHWERDQRPFWALKEGMPVYGIGTTFGNESYGGMFYHNFQIFHPGSQEMFWERCEKELNS
jgi:hypothetical protein